MNTTPPPYSWQDVSPVSDEIGSAEPFAKPSASSSSYGGNPLAATALATTIKTIEREKLVENSRTVGALMLERLRGLQEKYEFLGDVRGRGLLIGLDLVRDRISRRPLGRKAMELIFSESLKRGLLIMGYFPRVRINPPLVITAEQAEAGIAILDEVLAHVRDHADWRDGD